MGQHGEYTEDENKIIALLARKPEGMLGDELISALDTESDRITPVLNGLIQQGAILVGQGAEGRMNFTLGDTAAAQRSLQLNEDERMVYQIVSNAQNKGIWTRDLRRQCMLSTALVTKILKSLEARKFIKSIKSVQQKNKKLFILYDLTPSREITGGAWYDGQEFDVDFIKELENITFQLIAQRGPLRCDEVEPTMRTASSVKLRHEDVQTVLNALVLDNSIESYVNEKGEELYAKVRGRGHHSALAGTPCGVCPVFGQCGAGSITPAWCEYLGQWLSPPSVSDAQVQPTKREPGPLGIGGSGMAGVMQ